MSNNQVRMLLTATAVSVSILLMTGESFAYDRPTGFDCQNRAGEIYQKSRGSREDMQAANLALGLCKAARTDRARANNRMPMRRSW